MGNPSVKMKKEQLVQVSYNKYIYRNDICAVYKVTGGYFAGDNSDIELELVYGHNAPTKMRLNIDTCHKYELIEERLTYIDPHTFAQIFFLQNQLDEFKKNFNF